jgi:hypothetical protein
MAVLSLDFLNAGRKYQATIYKDGTDADWRDKPEAYAIEKVVVDNRTKLSVKLAAGGGAAISIVAL